MSRPISQTSNGRECFPNPLQITYSTFWCSTLSVDQTIANLWTYWTNDTCRPPAAGDKTATCSRGFYGDYVIIATKKEHIKAGIDFARKNNLRLIIRNTGHDFLGRSTGYGALIVNVHSFKHVEFTKKYTGPGDYHGGAVTVGAGIQLRELYRLANAQKPPVVVIGGECPVSTMPPIVASTGHSLILLPRPLGSLVGLFKAADMVPWQHCTGWVCL